MATAGASELAGRCGLPALVVPLLALAVGQALWTPVFGIVRHRAELRFGWSKWLAIGFAGEDAGIHTVPLGLAVITGGLAGLSAGGAAAWPLSLLTAIGLALTWLLTIFCVGRFLWALAEHGLVLRTIDGAWFLVPAALLGAAIATADVGLPRGGLGAGIMAALALGAALSGWFGYWAVALAALVRIGRFGLSGVPRAPWWIGMGCAGLAAAALGRGADGPAAGPGLSGWLAAATGATAICAVALAVPVIVGGVRFLLSDCRFRDVAPWPPTFSTAVFALGCLQAGELLPSPEFRLLGLGASYATLLFWAVTAAWNVSRLLRRRS